MDEHDNGKKEKTWFPLESNPDLLNSYISNLGFSTKRYSFTDVYSTEDWALDLIPHPVLALIVLFPMTEKVVKRRGEMHANSLDCDDESNVWYMKQRIRNACGTIAILHALANTPKHIQSTEIESSSWIQCFLQKCSTRSPTQRASHLENDTTIESYHESATDHVTNQTARPNRDDATDMHFASFVCVDGKLYELDGRLDDPICHGETIQPHLLKDSCGIVGKWMGADVDELRFTMLALCEVQR